MGAYQSRWQPGESAILATGLGTTSYYGLHLWMIFLLVLGVAGGVYMQVKGWRGIHKEKPKGAAATAKRMPLYMGFGTTLHASCHLIDHCTMVISPTFPPAWVSKAEGALFMTGVLIFALSVLLGCLYYLWFFWPSDLTKIMKRQKMIFWGKNDWRFFLVLGSTIVTLHIAVWVTDGFGPMSPFVMFIAHPVWLFIFAGMFTNLFFAGLGISYLLKKRIVAQAGNASKNDSGQKALKAQLKVATKLRRYMNALNLFFMCATVCMWFFAFQNMFGDVYDLQAEVVFMFFGTFVNLMPCVIPVIWHYNQAGGRGFISKLIDRFLPADELGRHTFLRGSRMSSMMSSRKLKASKLTLNTSKGSNKVAPSDPDQKTPATG